MKKYKYFGGEERIPDVYAINDPFKQ